MTKKQLTAALQLKSISLYTIRKDRKGGYNVTYAYYLANNCISSVRDVFIMADNYEGVLRYF